MAKAKQVAAVAAPGTQVVPATPMQLLQVAVSQNADIDKLKQLMDLQERWEANNARKAYVEAMSAFKAEPTVIIKTKLVNIPGGARFAHATLAAVVDGVVANLSKFGLSHRWEVSQADGAITVSCVVTHVAGHSERTTMSAPADDSGKKNLVQQIGSTITYLQRYTLMAAMGLAAKDMQDVDDAKRGKDQQAANAPEGFDKWQADMEACADEGENALKNAWQKSPPKFRVFATALPDGWWETTKRKAKEHNP